MFQRFSMLARSLEISRPMTRGMLITGTLALAVVISSTSLDAQDSQPVAAFKSSVDLVRVTAVVRDRKGRFVQDLKPRDFEVVDNGRSRAISDLQADIAGISVAVLFDVSGSMEGHMTNAREAATQVLSWLDASRDEAAIYTFDTRLDERAPFTTGLKSLPASIERVVPFGATSLHDAIAQTAQRVGERDGRRRAVIVLTDGADNASRMRPEDVSAVASAIDVPVYIFGIVASIDNPSQETSTLPDRSALSGPLFELAAWTGGHVFTASTPAQRSVAARQIIDELRHQYLIAFESSGTPGWHPLVVRARNKDLTVRARSGYIAGQFRPSH
jgi:Ca-activated chloride channel family protein